ncbi:hypothetical protein [Fluoribacter gormanii]|uniref:hypothetical protein n=1 Tax=Fluoribacter gormanii TaxID=464 RepID=UPI001041ADBA|nr:hypothetical protein [Fluoribacter gormanii]
MKRAYRIVFESFDKENLQVSRKIIFEEDIKKPENLEDILLSFANQLLLLKALNNSILDEKVALLNSDKKPCPECGSKLCKFGNQTSKIHDVLTDHDVQIQRLKCCSCSYEEPSTISALLHGNTSVDLLKIQTILGANFSYRECEKILALFCQEKRKINNHTRIKEVVNSCGMIVEQINEDELDAVFSENSKELILAIDSRHVQDTKEGKKIEIIVSVAFKPHVFAMFYQTPTHDHKNCSVSIIDNDLEHAISSTLIAALKQGLCSETDVTVLMDGKDNSKQIAQHLEPLCKSASYFIDWFYIVSRLKELGVPQIFEKKLLRVEWHLWRGRTKEAIHRIKSLYELVHDQAIKKRLAEFEIFININSTHIPNYKERKKAGLIYTIHVDDRKYHSLINQRGIKQKYIKWSKEGLATLLKLRAFLNSQGWSDYLHTIFNTYKKNK